MASAFLGKYVSITGFTAARSNPGMKLDSWNFHESNLTKARFEIISFSTILLINTISIRIRMHR